MVALGALAACAFVAGRLFAAKGLSWAANVSNVLSLVLTAVALLVPQLGKLLGWLRGAPPVSPVTLQQARDSLADVLAGQWAEEDRLRRVHDPWPLPVRWQFAKSFPKAGGPAGSDAAEGFADILTAYTRVPAHRLVLLGPAGAGKSVLAIKLVRDLLAARRPGEPVPVLLPAATWTSDSALPDWIAEQLVRTQPSLDALIRTDTGEKVWLPRALADSGVIPVIDGLDELPEGRRAAVVAEVNAHGSDYPLVLTSRPEEYYAAVAARPVSQAVVVEMQPLRTPEVKEYLTEATDAPSERWRSVFGRLDAERDDGVLATVLSTPLMVWLTRTVYEAAETDPDELLDPNRFADREAVESHLITAFVPAVYAGRRRRSRLHAFRCTAEQATKWLGFLADRLNRSSTQEIAWWRLSLAERGWLPVSMAIRAVLVACVVWEVNVRALTRRGYWRHGRYVAHGRYQDLLLAGPLGHAVRPLTNRALQAIAQSQQSTTVRHLSSNVDSVVRGVAHLGLFRVACLAAAVGVLGGIINLISTNTPAPQTLRMTWRSVWRRLFGPLPWLAVVAFLWWYAGVHHQGALVVVRTPAGQVALLWFGLVLGARVATSLKMPTAVTATVGPSVLLRADRHAYLVRVVSLAAGFGLAWLWAGGVLAIADSLVSIAGLLMVLLLGSGTGGAWARYHDARLRLAARGRLPWRTRSFLADAHQRGVLRQTGATYQFRHIRLQQQLAAGYSPWPHPLIPVAAWASERLPRLRAFLALQAAQPGNGAPDPGDATEFTASGEIRKTSVLSSLGVPLSAVIVATLVLNVVFGRTGWKGLIWIVDSWLILKVAFVFDKSRAIALLPAGRWSIRVTADAINLMRASESIRLTADDIELIAVRPIGVTLSCYAVSARLRSGFTAPVRTLGGWLPLYWAPDYTAKVPRALVSALAGFAGNRLDPKLGDWLKRQGAVEYEASGTLEVTTVSATIGRGRLAGGIAALVLTIVFTVGLNWSVPATFAILADIIFIGICAYKLGLRAAKRKLPAGPWSLRVLADTIELTRAGRSIRLLPDDVESIATRTIGWGRTAVQARLRPGGATRLHAPDGWFPLYWTPDLSGRVPPDLVAALAGFAHGRLTGPLKRRAKAIRSPKAPVHRARAPRSRQ